MSPLIWRRPFLRHNAAGYNPDMPPNNPTVQQTCDIWNRIAPWWDEQVADGNDFQKSLIMPATDRLLAPKPGQTILDVACGNGNYARSLSRRGVNVVACD